MNTYPPLTNIRSSLADQFSALRTRALRASLWAKLTGRNTSLAIFPDQAPRKSPNRKLIGVKDIPIAQIVGTLNRQSDFDHQFRPIKAYLRDRWVNVYLALENGGWPPVVVHKVGEQYYVEDGHHRVSVARALGSAFIQAKIWEYPVQSLQAANCQTAPCPKGSSAHVYCTMTE
jgi:hypothetical protein